MRFFLTTIVLLVTVVFSSAQFDPFSGATFDPLGISWDMSNDEIIQSLEDQGIVYFTDDETRDAVVNEGELTYYCKGTWYNFFKWYFEHTDVCESDFWGRDLLVFWFGVGETLESNGVSNQGIARAILIGCSHMGTCGFDEAEVVSMLSQISFMGLDAWEFEIDDGNWCVFLSAKSALCQNPHDLIADDQNFLFMEVF